MANICTNLLYLSTGNKELGKSIVNSLRESFECSDGETRYEDNFDCKMEFYSRWIFPQKEMEELTKDLPEDNDLYIRVLSFEFGCEYVGYNVYAGGGWHDKLADE